ncbi:hypothetical protein CXG81DRAFT_29212 [Caulochytrium protostelioides]|uniref:Amidophosphoribosyltransferase n=1 Tax=Caulochytrium protostelioides TaxID=1555241 RepID=A0A4P9XDQ3_9FUNG|nr:hypothetical protein CXG81DRAFT_29212 [Caulochytrium protostelioides]|eukprot:RKP03613.1 hypothetical protein CXG81DRAFT_29212 [Caulochytrium protostelioides]
MCGIIGVLLANANASAALELYEGLGVLQHRGQDAAGIITCGARGRLYQHKRNGLVRDVFTASHLADLVGSMGCGHVRYPTAGSSSHSEAQPFYVNSPFGLVLAHNGNLTNAAPLRRFLDESARRHVNTDSDSEILLNIFAHELSLGDKVRIDNDDLFAATTGLLKKCVGGFACVAMVAGYGLLGFRDPHGIRPLVIGRRRAAIGSPGAAAGSDGYDYMMASESVALAAQGYTQFEDVQPGECVIIPRSGPVVRRACAEPRAFTPCIFEFVYFARPDSVMDGISVYQSRLAMGEALAEQVRAHLAVSGDTIDVVIPVPDTSRSSALQVATRLGVPYREGFIKNRYIGRTFIMPGQQQRVKSVRRKLNAMPLEFHNKCVLLVDDSIVRGTTSKEIVQMAREAGAKRVLIASCAPPIRFPNVYGIDMPTRGELVAYQRDEAAIADFIAADGVIYQKLDALIDSVRRPLMAQFDVSVFNGEYVTGDIDEAYLQHLEHGRGGMNGTKTPVAQTTIGLYNQHDGPR